MKFLLFCVKVSRVGLFIGFIVSLIAFAVVGGLITAALSILVLLPFCKWLDGLLIEAEIYLEK